MGSAIIPAGPFSRFSGEKYSGTDQTRHMFIIMLKETRQIHAIVGLDTYRIMTRYFSYFCPGGDCIADGLNTVNSDDCASKYKCRTPFTDV